MSAFGENFPYTNFHDLNLDWILKIIEDFQSKYTTIDTAITDGEEAIDSAKTEALQELDNNITDAMSQIDYAVQNTQRRYIILADSYGTRTTAAGFTFGQIVKNALGIADDNYYYNAVPGASFGTSDTTLKFLNILQGMTIDHPETITDIIIECGANDNYLQYEQVANALEQFANYAKATFPKAHVYLFACGMTMTREQLFKRKWETLSAFENASQFGMNIYLNSDSVLMNTVYLESDRTHPNANGVTIIAWQLCHAIVTGCCYENHFRLDNMSMNPVGTVENPPVAVNSFNVLLNISRNNNQLYVGAVNYIDVGFNDYNVSLTADNYFNIEIDNCLGLFADKNWYPCTFVNQSGQVLCEGLFTVLELNNGKYQIRIRPLYNISTGAGQSHVHIYFGMITNQ